MVTGLSVWRRLVTLSRMRAIKRINRRIIMYHLFLRAARKMLQEKQAERNSC
ncbi:MAG TPA: hypothetical protein GX711_02135 [Clostridia bacterium]|nr:hypothetical protein [Clostridia bacterium]